MAFNKLSLAEKISTKAIKVGDCLIWQGQKDKRGYGFLRLDGRLQRAHRIAFVLRNGPIPEGMVILHACDNPSCVNPDHLSMGTQHANVRDMLDKGRANKATGNRNAKTKLTQSLPATGGFIARRPSRDAVAPSAGAMGFTVGQLVRVSTDTGKLRTKHFMRSGKTGTVTGFDIGGKEIDVKIGRDTRAFEPGELEVVTA